MSNPDQLDVLDSQTSASDRSQYLEALKAYSPEWNFSIVDGHFKQSSPATDESKFNYLKEHFGVTTTWRDVLAELKRLNAGADPNTTYKVLILARHGQGYHNMAHSQYGNQRWNEHWSKLEGDGTLVWGPDPELTDLGIGQAKENGVLWDQELKNGAKVPCKWYVSPMRRSIDTLLHTWTGIVDINEQQPIVLENLRETTGVHTCDKRLPRSTIAAAYPRFRIEEGFTEEDELYKDDYRETVAEISVRMNLALQQIFSETSRDDDVVCITSHLGAIRAQLLVLGHRLFAVGTGGVIPVFVRATKVKT